MQEDVALEKKSRLVAEPSVVDEVELVGSDRLILKGWVFQDTGSSACDPRMRFSVNGHAPLSVEYPTPRPDVQKVFWQRPGAELSGFAVTVPLEFSNGVLEFRCADSQTTLLDSGRESWVYPDQKLHENLPDEDRRYRVIGNRDPKGFLGSGATDAFRIKAAYDNARIKRERGTFLGSGRWLARFSSLFGREKWFGGGAVLDWGCGCGRLARHLAPHIGRQFFGCDIDADNVSWCAANLPGSYKASLLSPPLPYEDKSFDVIYGLSVFTHLRANWETAWLKELHRVLKPGGTILMSVHGQTAIDFAALEPSVYKNLMDRVEREGLVVTSENNQLDGFVECPSEYVNVFHSQKHIRDVWGQFFVDIEILPGYVYTHDLVVATKNI
jgi:SAM-dependent methyltransferase